MRKYVLCCVMLSFILSFPVRVWADRDEEGIAYKLALMHTRALAPEQYLIKKDLRPDRSTIAEFEWILQSLQSRCVNPEHALADTIVEIWKSINQAGAKMSILDVARELANNARNTSAFGASKVNFRATSKVWLTSKLTKRSVAEIIRMTR